MTSPDPHLHEHTVSSEAVYEGALLHVRRDMVRLPDGGHAPREYIVHPGAAMIVPVLPGGKLLFERQYRHPHQRVFIEFPAGKRDHGEGTLVTAQRELLEETGYAARDWSFLGRIHPCITYTTEEIDLYVARDLDFVGRRLDAGEFLDTFEASVDEALGWAARGELTDVKTLVGLLLFSRSLAGSP